MEMPENNNSFFAIVRKLKELIKVPIKLPKRSNTNQWGDEKREEYIANLLLKKPKKDNELLKLACKANPPALKVIKLFVDYGLDINYKDNYKETPFHYACKNKLITIEVIKYLLQKGADPNIWNSNRKTPFHYACSNPNVDVNLIKVLIENGAHPNYEDSNCTTPFYMACNSVKPNPQNIKYLLENGANANKQEKDLKWTPLHLICNRPFSQENEDILLILLAFRAEINKKDFEEKTAKMMAKEKQNYELFNIISEYEKRDTIWKYERHQFFCDQFKETVLSFLLSIYRIFSLEKKYLRPPKPIIEMIIAMISTYSYVREMPSKNITRSNDDIASHFIPIEPKRPSKKRFSDSVILQIKLPPNEISPLIKKKNNFINDQNKSNNQLCLN